MFKTFSQNKFIIFLVLILLFSGLVVTGFAFLENSKNTKLTNSSQVYNSNSNFQTNSLNNSNSTNNSQNKTNLVTNSNQNVQETGSTNSDNSNSVSQPKKDNSKKITNAEFTKHFSKTDCWVSFEKKVYDMTTYLSIHPGGSGKLARFCSKEIDTVSANHTGGPFGSIKIQDILAPFYVGELVE